MNLDEKLRIAQVLEGMGVDVIEAGFPIASDGDFEAVREIAKIVKDSVVCGLARATKMDIERCAEAIKPASRGRIHTFISTSPLHMEYKLQMEPDEVHEAVIESVGLARKHTRRRGMVVRGRLAHRARLPLPLRRKRPSRRAPPRSIFPTPWATPCPMNSPP